MMNMMYGVAKYLVEVGGMSCVSCTYRLYMSVYMSVYMMMWLGTMKCGHHRATFVTSLIRNSSISLLKRLRSEYLTFFSSESIARHSSIFGFIWSESECGHVPLSQAALSDLRIPKVQFVEGGEGDDEDFTYEDDLSDEARISTSNVPLLVTLTKVGEDRMKTQHRSKK